MTEQNKSKKSPDARNRKIAVSLAPVTIGSITIAEPLILAPMAGVSDFPLREIARQNGAGLCISEMVTSKTELWHTAKSSARLPSMKDPEPRPIQIAGADPIAMAEAAKRCADMGAGIIDINMGCPAKKVCARAAGSALLADEVLVADILNAVVNAVDIPVTLKTRTGTEPSNKNIRYIAQLAESIGIQALTIHGRTRACRFRGSAEYDSIAEVVSAVSIPVFANGDITSPRKALEVIQHTNAAGLMIGRGAWGKPWLFRQIRDALDDAPTFQPSVSEILDIVRSHLYLIYEELGETRGVRFARKHVDHYVEEFDSQKIFRKKFNQLETSASQIKALTEFFEQLQELSYEAA